MTPAQFDQWCRAGKPALLPTVAMTAMTRGQVEELVGAAVSEERAHVQAGLQALAEILGAECGANERVLRAELAEKIAQLAAQMQALRDKVAGPRLLHTGGCLHDSETFDLPADWRPHHAH
jgi:hypothetical protein